MTPHILTEPITLLPEEQSEPPLTRPPRLHPYFLEQGEEAGLGHDFLLQNPRPDLTETIPWPFADERRKLALDLP